MVAFINAVITRYLNELLRVSKGTSDINSKSPSPLETICGANFIFLGKVQKSSLQHKILFTKLRMLFWCLTKFKIIRSLYVRILKYYNLLSSTEAGIRYIPMPLLLVSNRILISAEVKPGLQRRSCHLKRVKIIIKIKHKSPSSIS